VYSSSKHRSLVPCLPHVPHVSCSLVAAHLNEHSFLMMPCLHV
jgi:hypothetical protein